MYILMYQNRNYIVNCLPFLLLIRKIYDTYFQDYKVAISFRRIKEVNRYTDLNVIKIM